MSSIVYVGLDVHKEKISVGFAVEGRGEAEFFGEITNSGVGIWSLLRRLGKKDDELRFCYEAGPCGYDIYRHLNGRGYGCEVVAPSLIPSKPGDKVKTNRRDALKLARLYRAGELTSIHVPTEKQEALRDLFRGREDALISLKRAKQTLNGFLLRHRKRYPGRCRWKPMFYRWLDTVKFEHREQSIVLEDYIEAVKGGERRVESLEKEMRLAFERWDQRPIGEALIALRGVDFITAMGLLTELGDMRRFNSPTELMSYVGLVPSEYSSGNEQRRGSITKTGNSHIRRLLIESAWCARHAPRRTAHWRKGAQNASAEVQAIAWKAMKRLHQRYWQLQNRRVPSTKVVTAVARELVGFIWSVAMQAYAEQEGRMKKAA